MMAPVTMTAPWRTIGALARIRQKLIRVYQNGYLLNGG